MITRAAKRVLGARLRAQREAALTTFEGFGAHAPTDVLKAVQAIVEACLQAEETLLKEEVEKEN